MWFCRHNQYLSAPEKQALPLKQLNLAPQPALQTTNLQQLMTYRQQPLRACFEYGDPSHSVSGSVSGCPLKKQSRNPVQQQVNSSHTDLSGKWTCPSNPQGMDTDDFTATLSVQGSVAMFIKFGHTSHSVSECTVSESVKPYG